MKPRLVPLPQDIPGLDRFIGSWVCLGKRNLVIDIGPSASVARLVKSLREMGVDRVDLVLLTHIHIDHAGGLAPFLDEFPMAKALCHAKGLKHLVDPSRLWEGSLSTLGDLALKYGPIPPVERGRLIPHTEVDIKGLRVVETPGHAPHHLSFLWEGNLFAGEAGGVFFRMDGGEYLRPATPPVFFLKESLGTIDRLLALEDQPIFFAHLARAESSHALLGRARSQLLLWRDVIAQELSAGQERLLERCLERLWVEDPEVRTFQGMDPEEQLREAYFAANSVRGILGFLEGES